MEASRFKLYDYLQAFFFVTVSGAVYAARTKGEPGKLPEFDVTKIYHPPGSETKIPVGEKLPNAPYLAITAREGVFCYDEDHPRDDRRLRAEDTNTAYWRGGTNLLVALFRTEAEALGCAETSGRKGIEFDARWHTETLDVLNMISDDHPRFVPSRFASLNPWDAIKKAAKI